MIKNILFTLLISMVGVKSFAFSAKNEYGKLIYYRFINDKTELAVDNKWDLYSGKIAIPEFVTYNGKTYPVTRIGSLAFSGCKGLTSITIPNSVTNIEGCAFKDCSGLKEVYVESPTPPSVKSDSFDFFMTLYVPTGSISNYNKTYWYELYNNILEYTPSKVNAICNNDYKETVRYTLDGKRSNSIQKGINIIRTSNGTTKKIFVKQYLMSTGGEK